MQDLTLVLRYSPSNFFRDGIFARVTSRRGGGSPVQLPPNNIAEVRVDVVRNGALSPVDSGRAVVSHPGSETYEDLCLVMRYTRHWIHYGFFAHVGLFVLAAAAQGVVSAAVQTIAGQ